jgi:transcriptional regulator with XRE-family HTH domain
MSNYSSRIKQIINDKELSVSDFCKLIGLNSPTTIHLLIKENRKPSSKTVDRILEAFPQYTKDWILYGIEEQKKIDDDDLTVTAKQVINYIDKKEIIINNNLVEYELKVINSVMNKMDEEAQFIKDISGTVSTSLSDLQNRIEQMEHYLILLEKDARKIINDMKST